MKYLLIPALCLFSILPVFTQTNKDWIAEEQKARTLFDKGQYDQAIILFREIALSSDNETVKQESYFWIAKAYINSGKYKPAATSLDYYIASFKESGLNYPEALYQKGRLLFLEEQYQESIEQLYSYIEKYPKHELVSNGYYWIGECLYALGQFDDSSFAFKIVLEKYPASLKREASVFKLRLIEHKKSELALQNLLKWSQEQFISSLNQFKIKEKTLRQAIEEYEKNKSRDELSKTDSEYTRKLMQENDELKQKLAQLEKELKNNQGYQLTDKDLAEKMRQLELKQQLLDQKEETLRILENELKRKENSLER